MLSGYEQTYEALVHKLADCDFDEATARLGLGPPVNRKAAINFLNRNYIISSEGIIASDGMSSDPNARSILIHYITSPGKGEPAFSYSMLHHFIPISLRGGSSLSWLTAPLAIKFGNAYAGFEYVLRALGATLEKALHENEYIWSYKILPKIPMQIIYMEADNEFPCEIQFKLDDNASKFMEFEQLAFLCGCLAKALSTGI